MRSNPHSWSIIGRTAETRRSSRVSVTRVEPERQFGLKLTPGFLLLLIRHQHPEVRPNVGDPVGSLVGPDESSINDRPPWDYFISLVQRFEFRFVCLRWIRPPWWRNYFNIRMTHPPLRDWYPLGGKQATTRVKRSNSFHTVSLRQVLGFFRRLREKGALFLGSAHSSSGVRLSLRHICHYYGLRLLVLVNHQNWFKDRIGHSTVNSAHFTIVMLLEREFYCLQRVSI